MSESQETVQTPAAEAETVELMRSLSKKLSESDVLETQEYSKILKMQIKNLEARIRFIEEVSVTLADQLAAAERGASLSGAEGCPVIKTEFTKQLEELRTEVEDLYKMVLEESKTQVEMLERTIALRRRTDSRMAVLFNQIFSESKAVDKKLELVNARLRANAEPDPADVERRRQILKTLNKIKRDRCIFFGCVDVHPEELYRITGASK